MWTVLLALCPSTESPLTHWSTSTPSTPHSLNLFILGLDSGHLVPQCLCVQCRRKSKPLQCISFLYLLGVERLTNSTVRFISRFCGHGFRFDICWFLGKSIMSCIVRLKLKEWGSLTFDTSLWQSLRFASVVNEKKKLRVPMNPTVHTRPWQAYRTGQIFLMNCSTPNIYFITLGFILLWWNESLSNVLIRFHHQSSVTQLLKSHMYLLIVTYKLCPAPLIIHMLWLSPDLHHFIFHLFLWLYW